MEVSVTIEMLDANPEWRARLRKNWLDHSLPNPSTTQQIDKSDSDTPQLLER